MERRCCPCRCSGSGKLAVPGFPHGRLSYRTDRCLFAFHGSQAPFRDIRVPESCLLPETRELPAFLHSHTVRGSTAFPRLFPAVSVYLSCLLRTYSGRQDNRVREGTWGNFRKIYVTPAAMYVEMPHDQQDRPAAGRKMLSETACLSAVSCIRVRETPVGISASSASIQMSFHCLPYVLSGTDMGIRGGMCIFCRKQLGVGSQSLPA